MSIVDEKIAFAEKHIRNKEGVPWRLKGREWVRDEFWRPADGWKLWRFDDSEPCATCAERIGQIIDHPSDNPTKKCKCGGLAAEPILVTVLNLERGDGKTFNLMAYSLATLFTAKNKSMSGMWASEDQGARIFEENWQRAIEQAPALRDPRRSRIHGSPPVLDALATHSRMEVLAASHSSSTGGRRTHIFYDEARDVPARVAMALLPAINAMHGVECPVGHVQLTPEDVERMGKIPKKCSACGRLLVEWWPRVIIASASGVLGSNDRDWLYELVDYLEANPHKNYHLFTSAKWGKALNPRKSEKVTNAVTEVFGALPSTRDYVAAEYGNQWTQKGEDVMTPADVKRVMDPRLANEEGCTSRAIGFLDTSETKEKTALVILAEDAERSTFPFEHVYMSYFEYWWPGHGRHKSWKRIDENEVKQALEFILPLYPGLVRFAIDTKLGARKLSEETWGLVMLRDLKRGGADRWRKLIEPWRGGADESDMGWDFFTARVADQTLVLQNSPEILEEVKGVYMYRPKQGDGRAKVKDRNRRTMHKDITEAIACLCWMIKKEQLRTRRTWFVNDNSVKQVVASRMLSGGSPAQRLGKYGGDWT